MGQVTLHLNNKTPTYKCKSTDNDFGLRTLQPKGEWEFSFSPALLKITDFYYYFWYANFKATFNVYVEYSKLEANCGGDYCIWTTQEDGFYLYNMFLKINVVKTYVNHS